MATEAPEWALSAMGAMMCGGAGLRWEADGGRVADAKLMVPRCSKANLWESTPLTPQSRHILAHAKQKKRTFDIYAHLHSGLVKSDGRHFR